MASTSVYPFFKRDFFLQKHFSRQVVNEETLTQDIYQKIEDLKNVY